MTSLFHIAKLVIRDAMSRLTSLCPCLFPSDTVNDVRDNELARRDVGTVCDPLPLQLDLVETVCGTQPPQKTFVHTASERLPSQQADGAVTSISNTLPQFASNSIPVNSFLQSSDSSISLRRDLEEVIITNCNKVKDEIVSILKEQITNSLST